MEVTDEEVTVWSFSLFDLRSLWDCFFFASSTFPFSEPGEYHRRRQMLTLTILIRKV